jgi:lycopene beta-cyclase
MSKGRNHGLLIAGGGVAGSLAALALAKLRPEVPILLAAEGDRFGGARPVLLLDQGLSDAEQNVLGTLSTRRWDGCYVALRRRSRKLKLACRLVSGEAIDSAVRAALPDKLRRSGARVVAIREESLLLPAGEALAGVGALDARGSIQQTILELGWRHVAARTYRFSTPHRVDLPVIADTTLETGGAAGHCACLPLSDDVLRVERTEYSRSPEPPAGIVARLATYVDRRGWSTAEPLGEDVASRPIPLGGDFAAYWRIGAARVAKLGARGGFVHPFTGSPLPDALRTALLLAGQKDFAGNALHDAMEAEAASLWKRRELHRSAVRMLFDPGRGLDSLEGLLDMEPGLLGRFMAEDLGLLDRRRIMAAAGG